MTASLSLITTSFPFLIFFLFFFLYVLFFSLQTAELSILKTDCSIDYVPFELCTVIGAFLERENFPEEITEIYQVGKLRHSRLGFKWFQFRPDLCT